jgi:hypothetical protein
MRPLFQLFTGLAITAGAFAMTGCQSDPAAMEDERRNPTLDIEHSGGMSRTGAGSDTGASSSGMDRAGGGLSGSHGANSGAPGNDPAWNKAAGPGGAPTPGR